MVQLMAALDKLYPPDEGMTRVASIYSLRVISFELIVPHALCAVHSIVCVLLRVLHAFYLLTLCAFYCVCSRELRNLDKIPVWA